MANNYDDTVASVNCFEMTNAPVTNFTMDQTTLHMNESISKSPNKLVSAGVNIPGRQGIGSTGRTMKECEDQLGYLKKENFDLKLRIYLLQESKGILSDEDMMKKNIELKVENESLRKELIEKQELLTQAAKAIELIEDQKQISTQSQTHYHQALKREHDKAEQLEKELMEINEKLAETMCYKEMHEISRDALLECEEKLSQFEQDKTSLELELHQLNTNLKEKENHAQQLQNEKDQIKIRTEHEISLKEKQLHEKDEVILVLDEKIKDLEQQLLQKNHELRLREREIVDKDDLIKEKNMMLQEKCQEYEKIIKIAEQRKSQIDLLRFSVKSRDDALTELNDKNKILISQLEKNYATKKSLSDVIPTYIEESQYLNKNCNSIRPGKIVNNLLTQEFVEENKLKFENHNLDGNKLDSLKKELEKKELELNQQESSKKELLLKMYNLQQFADDTNQKFKKLETDHKKAIQMIQGFIKRYEQLEDKHAKKDRRITELETELCHLRRMKISDANNFSLNQQNMNNQSIDEPQKIHNEKFL